MSPGDLVVCKRAWAFSNPTRGRYVGEIANGTVGIVCARITQDPYLNTWLLVIAADVFGWTQSESFEVVEKP